MLVVSLQARPDGEKAAVLCTVHRCMLAAEENETGPRLGQGESMFVNYSLCGVCVCVCVCVCGLCRHAYPCTCMHLCACILCVGHFVSVCVCVCMYVRVYVCLCVFTCSCIQTYGRKKKRKRESRQWLF